MIVSSSSDNMIHDNSFIDNSGSGLRIVDLTSIGNVIWNNTFFGNNGAGIQANDSGTNNSWNTSGFPHGYGNYWSDWTTPDANFDGIVDWSYNLSGSAGAMDWYPRTTPTRPIPEFSELVIPIVGLMLIALIVVRIRKKPERV